MSREEQKIKQRIALANSGKTDADLAVIEELNLLNDSIGEIKDKLLEPEQKEELAPILEQILEETKKKSEEEIYIEIDPEEIRGPQGLPGKDGKDGQSITGPKGNDGADGRDGEQGVPGRDGKDGSPDTPDEIKKKLETLKGEKRLDASAIKNLPEFVEQLPQLSRLVTGGGAAPDLSGYLTTTAAAATYLKLDTSNDPLTGSLAWSTATQGTSNSIINLPTAAGAGALQTYRLLMGGGGSSLLTVEGTDTIFQYNNFSSFGLGINRFKIDFGNTNALSTANEFVLTTKNFGLTVTDTLTISSQAAGWTIGSSSGLSFSNSSGSIQFSSAASVIFTGNANATINFGNLGTNVLNMEFKTALLGSGANLILVDGDKFTDTLSNNVGSFMLGVGGITPGNEGWAQIRTTYRAAANTSTAALHIAPAINNPSGSTVTYLASLNLEAPTLSNSGTAITNGVTLRVAAAPSTGTNLYAFWVDAGTSRFDGNLDFSTADATNIVLGTGTGTKIGTATSQKLGFFNATPIVQQTTTSQTPSTFAANTSGIVDDSATWDGYTIGDIVKILRVFGLIA